MRFPLTNVRETTVRSPQRSPLAVVRVPGFYLDSVDEGPPGRSISIDGGFDVITSFGVKNIDIYTDVRPPTDHVEAFDLGPQHVTVRFIEKGEPRGDSAVQCFHDYEVEAVFEPRPGEPAEAAAVVLAYR